MSFSNDSYVFLGSSDFVVGEGDNRSSGLRIFLGSASNRYVNGFDTLSVFYIVNNDLINKFQSLNPLDIVKCVFRPDLKHNKIKLVDVLI